jgi:glutamate--cysteine ligase
LSNFIQKLAYLDSDAGREALANMSRGIEREALRVNEKNHVSVQKHPEALGRPLTHPWITTDFSEAQVEMVTPVSNNLDVLFRQLHDLHLMTVYGIGKEYLWPTSMPCFVPNEQQVAIAHYGSSHTGKFKKLYREGLKNRYGAMMQMISGVHFNWSVSPELWALLHEREASPLSLQAFQDQGYLNLIRNFHELAWVVPYLFGASPAVCHSFLKEDFKTKHVFKQLGEGTFYLDYATSLRMSDLGYTTSEQDGLAIDYNSLEGYIRSLRQAAAMPSQRFKALNGKDAFGRAFQINDNILQIENEFYAPIRPKRVTQYLERPTDALERAGIEYVEVRLLDINPFSMLGIEESQVALMDLLLLHCLLSPAPQSTPETESQWRANLNKVVLNGRKPSVQLKQDKHSITLQTWLESLFNSFQGMANLLDQEGGHHKYSDALATWRVACQDANLTLSGQIMTQLMEQDLDHVHWAKSMAIEHQIVLKGMDYLHWDVTELEASIATSVEAQRSLEAREKGNFELYMAHYFSDKT